MLFYKKVLAFLQIKLKMLFWLSFDKTTKLIFVFLTVSAYPREFVMNLIQVNWIIVIPDVKHCYFPITTEYGDQMS